VLLAFAVYMMRNSETHSADYVVLTMFVGIVFTFAVAVVNWVSISSSTSAF
jgi:hypothetical protein